MELGWVDLGYLGLGWVDVDLLEFGLGRFELGSFYTFYCSLCRFIALPVRFRALDLDQLSVLDLVPAAPANNF